jgi:DNA mismatch repair protein MutS
VIARAREKLAQLEQQEVDQGSRTAQRLGEHPPMPQQSDLFASAPHPLVEELGGLALDDLTPRQALELLYRWRESL